MNRPTRQQYKSVASSDYFGRLKVLRQVADHVSPSGEKYPRFLCLCACGNRCRVLRKHLTSGNTTSCGCAHATRKGYQAHPLYMVWYNARQRCHNSRNRDYPNYGGRGIRLHKAWRDDPATMIQWLHAHLGFRRGRTLDRIDVQKGYEPGNLRWATLGEQARNRRDTNRVLYHGTLRSLADLVDEHQQNMNTVRKRLRLGWSLDRALTETSRGST